MKSLHIVFVTTYYWPYIGGIETHVAELARVLPTYGVEVEILCRSGLGRDGLHGYETSIDGVKVRRLGTIGAGEVARWPLGVRLPSRADAVHFHGYSRPLLARTLAQLGNRPLIFTLHGALQATGIDASPARRWSKLAIDRATARRWLRRASHTICLSPLEQRHLTKQLGIPHFRTSVWQNPCPDESFSPLSGTPVASGRFLVLGRLDRIKNVREILLALASDPTLPGCDIAGPAGDDSTRLYRLAETLVPRRVRFLGSVRGLEKVRLIRDAKALVICSVHEAQPTVALEALAQGTPVVASLGSAPGLPPNAALTYPGGDIGALVARLRSLDDPLVTQERQAVAAALQPQVCSSSQYASRLAELYRAVAVSPQTSQRER
jgi:glycogen(starch) synthase